MQMAVSFYIANAATSGNVVTVAPTTSLPYPPNVILPVGAVVTSVVINSGSATGHIDLGFTPLNDIGPGQNTTTGTPVPQGLLVNEAVGSSVTVVPGSTGAGAYLGVVTSATNVVEVTSEANVSASGAVTGYITYFVADDGTQSN
jgi:hypothetical protein